MTKPLLLAVAAGLFVSGAGRAADTNATAYTALRTMGKSLGQDTISRVVEVTGRGGMPQPDTWRIVILDGTRGTREVKVAGGQVVSQKSAGPVDARPIRLQDLKLDSSGAFDSADNEARKTKVPFTALDYSLRVNAATGKPVWNLELFNQTGAHVGGLRLAAHDGTLIAVNGLKPGQTVVTTQATPPRTLVSSGDADHDTVRPTQVTPGRGNTTTTTTTTYNTVQNPPPRNGGDDDDDERNSDGATPSSGEGGFFSRAGRTLDHTTEAVGDTLNRTGHAVDRTVRHTGTKIQRFFTGGNSDQNNAPTD